MIPAMGPSLEHANILTERSPSEIFWDCTYSPGIWDCTYSFITETDP